MFVWLKANEEYTLEYYFAESLLIANCSKLLILSPLYHIHFWVREALVIGEGRLWIKLWLTRTSKVQFVRQGAATLETALCYMELYLVRPVVSMIDAGMDGRRMASLWLEIDSNLRSRHKVLLRWPADACDIDCIHHLYHHPYQHDRHHIFTVCQLWW